MPGQNIQLVLYLHHCPKFRIVLHWVDYAMHGELAVAGVIHTVTRYTIF